MQLLGNWAPKYHTIEGIMGPNSLMVVYVDPLGTFKKGPPNRELRGGFEISRWGTIRNKQKEASL